MMSITITIKNDFIKKLGSKERWNQFRDQLLDNMGNEGLTLIKRYASEDFKHQTGNYIAKTTKKVENGKLTIKTDTPYANRLEKGNPETPMDWLTSEKTGHFAIKFAGKDGNPRFYHITKDMIGLPANNKSGKSWTYPQRDGLFIYKRAYKEVIRMTNEKLGKALKFVLRED